MFVLPNSACEARCVNAFQQGVTGNLSGVSGRYGGVGVRSITVLSIDSSGSGVSGLLEMPHSLGTSSLGTRRYVFTPPSLLA